MASLLRNIFLKQLKSVSQGQLIVQDQDSTWYFGDKNSNLKVLVRVFKPHFYKKFILGGSLAAAEMYAEGDWVCEDLTSLLRLLLRNQQALTQFKQGLVVWTAIIKRLLHATRRNNLLGSRRNIAKHYDLSNDFFKTFLDDTMMYSSAMFPTPKHGLYEASLHKLDVICKKLNLQPGDKVIEIGTGWGGFALHAAKYYGCEVVTTTISEQQYLLAEQRIAQENLGDRITLLKQDYRNLSGQYDKLVSIEMIEAVGHHYFKTFFKVCAKLLKPEGQMLVQAITIQDQHYERAKLEVDFIKEYIFPGSCIPSVTALLTAMTQASDLRLYHLEDLGLHYAKTLLCWRERFLSQAEVILKLGFDQRFMRLWVYYFCYCEAGFAEGYLGNVHLHVVKPLAIRDKMSWLEPSRSVKTMS